MNITIETTVKEVIHKHLDEAMENREPSVIYLQKLETGFYRAEITRSTKEPEIIAS